MLESVLQKAVISYLRRLQNLGAPILGFHIPNAGRRSRRTGAQLKREGLLPGAPDLAVLLPRGRVVWIELKSGSGRQSSSQRDVQSILEAMGHDYCIVRADSSADAVAIVAAIVEPLLEHTS